MGFCPCWGHRPPVALLSARCGLLPALGGLVAIVAWAWVSALSLTRGAAPAALWGTQGCCRPAAHVQCLSPPGLGAPAPLRLAQRRSDSV